MYLKVILYFTLVFLTSCSSLDSNKSEVKSIDEKQVVKIHDKLKKITIDCFLLKECSDCRRVEPIFEEIQKKYPNVEYKIEGEVNSVRLIHSGENFALVVYSDPNFSSMESGYVIHRSPKVESENTIEKIHIGGNIIAVDPDESGYFYISQGKIFKRSWEGETMLTNDLGLYLEKILYVQLISTSHRIDKKPILFFSNNTKMAFWGTPTGERWSDGYLFIWDLENNKIEKIPRQDLLDYNDLRVEDDKLYIERIDSSVVKKIIAE